MDIDIKDLVTLDNNIEYIVTSKTTYEDDIYYYFVNNNDNKDFKILRLNKDNNKLVEFDNQELIKRLLPLFVKETLFSIKDENSNNVG